MDYSQYFEALHKIYKNFNGRAKIRMPHSDQIDEGWIVFGTIGNDTNDVTRIRARKHGCYNVIEMTLDDFLAVNRIDKTDPLSG